MGARGLWALPIGIGALPAMLAGHTIAFAQNQPTGDPIPAAFYQLLYGFMLVAAVDIVWALVQGVMEWRRGA